MNPNSWQFNRQELKYSRDVASYSDSAFGLGAKAVDRFEVAGQGYWLKVSVAIKSMWR